MAHAFGDRVAALSGRTHTFSEDYAADASSSLRLRKRDGTPTTKVFQVFLSRQTHENVLQRVATMESSSKSKISVLFGPILPALRLP